MFNGQTQEVSGGLSGALTRAGLPADLREVMHRRFRFGKVNYLIECTVVNVTFGDQHCLMLYVDVTRYREVEVEALIWRHGEWQVKPADESTWIPTGKLIPL